MVDLLAGNVCVRETLSGDTRNCGGCESFTFEQEIKLNEFAIY